MVPVEVAPEETVLVGVFVLTLFNLASWVAREGLMKTHNTKTKSGTVIKDATNHRFIGDFSSVPGE
jgi:hypothetical protein